MTNQQNLKRIKSLKELKNLKKAKFLREISNFSEEQTTKEISEMAKLKNSQSEIVEVTFRSQDYVFTFERDNQKREMAGVILRKDNLTENGFKIVTHNRTIFYNLL